LALPIAPPPEGTPRWRAAEIFLGTYAAIVAVTAVSRVGLSRGNWLVALANVLIILCLWLVTRPGLGPTGRILREASPSLRSFDFPFYVGKEWRSVFTFQDNQKGLSWTPVEVFWRVKEYDEVSVPLTAGDVFVFCTDGVFDANNEAGEDFNASRLADVVRLHRNKTAKEIVDAIFDAVTTFRGNAPQTDDVTAVAVKIRS